MKCLILFLLLCGVVYGDYPYRLKITGDLTPAAAVKSGLVKQETLVNGYPQWIFGTVGLGTEYWWIRYDGENWLYSYAIGGVFNNEWIGGSDPTDPLGEYTIEVGGTATVSEYVEDVAAQTGPGCDEGQYKNKVFTFDDLKPAKQYNDPYLRAVKKGR